LLTFVFVDLLFQRRESEFDNGCSHIGLPCDDSESFTCFCRPCVEANEVDVYHLEEGENDPHLNESYDKEYPGCDKMEICATIQQGESVTLRIYDNMMRNDTKITVEVHAGGNDKKIQPKPIPGTSAYEFVVTDREVQVQVIEILVDGKPIATSPIRVVVEDFDCEAANPGENLVPNNMGECGKSKGRLQ
jgi:hypothetical protein